MTIIEAPEGTTRLILSESCDPEAGPLVFDELEFVFLLREEFVEWCGTKGIKLPKVFMNTKDPSSFTIDVEGDDVQPYLEFESDEDAVIFKLLWPKDAFLSED